MKLPEMEAEEQQRLIQHASSAAAKGVATLYEELGVKFSSVLCSMAHTKLHRLSSRPISQQKSF